jgi:RND family efflux transporter MFP subunit
MNRKKVFYVLAAFMVSGFLLTLFFFKDHLSNAKTADNDIPLVRAAVLHAGEAARAYTYSGEVRGRQESQLAFQVGGKITNRQVELGSRVKPGQILMQIDPKDIRQLVQGLAAQVDSAQSQLQLAENNLKRYRQLYEQDVISRAQLDRYQSAYEVAAAGHRQASAQYAQGANQLAYSSLCADKAGVVSGISAEVGQVVGAGQAVVTLVQDGEREIEINVPENRIDNLRRASQIKVAFWALPQVVIVGKVREVAPMADTISRTYKIRISLLNPPPEIKLGMTASAAVADSRDQAQAVLIPLSALYQTKETPCVWTVQNETAKLRAIKIGIFGDSQVQVLSGLQSGETIVTAGVHKLREGQKVRLMGGGAQ